MKWEYKIFEWNAAAVFNSLDDLVEDLNELGKDGWEVIDSVSTEFRGSEGITERTDTVVYLLKRQLN